MQKAVLGREFHVAQTEACRSSCGNIVGTGKRGGQLKVRRGAVVEINTRRAAGVAPHGRTGVERVDLEMLVLGRLGVVGHKGWSG